MNHHCISVAVEAVREDRRSEGSVSKGEWEDLGSKSGLLATVEPEWLKKVQICSLNDVDFGPLLKLGMKECKMLSVSERMSLKQYTTIIADELLFYTPSSGADNEPLRMCIPHSPNNTLRLLVLYEGHDAHLHMGIDKPYERWLESQLLLARYVEGCDALHY